MKQQDQEPTEEKLQALPLFDHLIEFRRRLIYSFSAVIVGFVICYFFAEDIYSFLVKPLAEVSGGEHRRLIYTGLAEAFVTYLKISLWGGVFLAFPVIAAQLWFFISPGLYRHEKKILLPLLISSPALFIIGAAMAYYLVFPLAWKFFLSFEMPASPNALPLQMEARISEYLSLSMSIILAFGLAFQLPVILVLMARVGIFSAEKLSEFRRYAIVIIFAIAAVITPPDVISQISLAIPMMLLYEVSILAVRWAEKHRQNK